VLAYAGITYPLKGEHMKQVTFKDLLHWARNLKYRGFSKTERHTLLNALKKSLTLFND